MTIERSMDLFYDYCRSKQLRPKTMQTYRQGLQLFELWLKGQGVGDATEICEMTIRGYTSKLQIELLFQRRPPCPQAKW